MAAGHHGSPWDGDTYSRAFSHGPCDVWYFAWLAPRPGISQPTSETARWVGTQPFPSAHRLLTTKEPPLDVPPGQASPPEGRDPAPPTPAPALPPPTKKPELTSEPPGSRLYKQNHNPALQAGHYSGTSWALALPPGGQCKLLDSPDCVWSAQSCPAPCDPMGCSPPDSLQPHGLHPAWLLCPWNFPGKITGVGCHAFLQGIFLVQRWNLSPLCLCTEGELCSAESLGLPQTSFQTVHPSTHTHCTSPTLRNNLNPALGSPGPAARLQKTALPGSSPTLTVGPDLTFQWMGSSPRDFGTLTPPTRQPGRAPGPLRIPHQPPHDQAL